MDWMIKRGLRGNYLWSLILVLSCILMRPYAWAENELTRPMVTDAQRENLLQLTADAPNHMPPKVIFNRTNGTPTLIKVKSFSPKTGQRQALALGRIENTARQFIFENRVLLKIDDPDQELNLVKSWSDPQGATHFKYQQMVDDIPVFGKQLLVHANSQNSIYLLNGRFEPTPSALVTTPTITENDAIEAVRQHLGLVDISPTHVELSIFTKPNGEMVLTYKVEVAPTPAEAWIYFIDADNGNFVHRISKIRNEIVSARGRDLNGQNRTFNAWHHTDNRYYLIDPSRPGPQGNVDNNLDYVTIPPLSPGITYVFSANNTGSDEEYPDLYHLSVQAPNGNWDQAGVSAMVNTRTIYQYYHNTFQRKGLDDNFMNYNVVVHFGEQYANAFFTPEAPPLFHQEGAIFFGDGGDAGDGITFSNLAESLDVTAHELQHGITHYTAGLIYENQSGALDEAYSDLFACMVDRDDWTVGEDVVYLNQSPSYLRNLADPTQGAQPGPTKMSEYQDLPNTYEGDWGGVHVNMSIPSHAGFLMATGLDNSIGRPATAQIWYHALAYLTSDSEFVDARAAMVQAAEELYGSNSTEVAAVQAAWDEVEVYDDGATPVAPTEITLSEQSISFSNISVGRQSSKVLTLTNDSERDINIDNIAITGSSNFTHDGNIGPLPGHQAMDIKVTYMPQKAGSEAATLLITSDADIPTDNVSITGRAVSDHKEKDNDDNGVGGCFIRTIAIRR
jgi:bacillolysin